jgi:predicted nuclease of predicted toxin-antitoxin system
VGRIHGRVIITHDLDLTTLLALTGANGPSVVQLRTQDILPDTASDLLLQVLREFREQLNAGAIVTVEEDRRRVRILPLSR